MATEKFNNDIDTTTPNSKPKTEFCNTEQAAKIQDELVQVQNDNENFLDKT